MCLWHASRHALRIHHLLAQYRGQPRESLGHYKNRADLRRQGRTESHELPSSSQLLHLMVGEQSFATIPSPQEDRVLRMDFQH
jgi:hypothetical protein